MLKVKSSVDLLREALNRSDEECLQEFMGEIAEKMAKKYPVSFDSALEYVKMQEVQKRIEKDMEWSEHMGPYFWANEIYELYIANDRISY